MLSPLNSVATASEYLLSLPPKQRRRSFDYAIIPNRNTKTNLQVSRIPMDALGFV